VRRVRGDIIKLFHIHDGINQVNWIRREQGTEDLGGGYVHRSYNISNFKAEKYLNQFRSKNTDYIEDPSWIRDLAFSEHWNGQKVLSDESSFKWKSQNNNDIFIKYSKKWFGLGYRLRIDKVWIFFSSWYLPILEYHSTLGPLLNFLYAHYFYVLLLLSYSYLINQTFHFAIHMFELFNNNYK